MADKSPAQRLGLAQVVEVVEGLSVVVRPCIRSLIAKDAGDKLLKHELIISNSFVPQRSDRTIQQDHSSGI